MQFGVYSNSMVTRVSTRATYYKECSLYFSLYNNNYMYIYNLSIYGV